MSISWHFANRDNRVKAPVNPLMLGPAAFPCARAGEQNRLQVYHQEGEISSGNYILPPCSDLVAISSCRQRRYSHVYVYTNPHALLSCLLLLCCVQLGAVMFPSRGGCISAQGEANPCCRPLLQRVHSCILRAHQAGAQGPRHCRSHCCSHCCPRTCHRGYHISHQGRHYGFKADFSPNFCKLYK